MSSLTQLEVLAGRVRAAARSFLPSSMPMMVRQNYRYELMAAALLPFMFTAVETGIITVLVRKSFDGVVPDRLLNYTVAALGASKAFANVVSFIWVRLNHGKDKRRFTIGALCSMACLIALLALVPRSAGGLWIFVAIVIAVRMIWSGYITIRSTIWQANYPRVIRARITGKTATVQVLTASLLGSGMGLAMDMDTRNYRVLLIAGSIIGLGGIYAWSRIRVRKQVALMRREREDDTESQPSINPLRTLRVLQEDHYFAGYIAAQFVLGMGNLMVPSVLAIMVKERFDLSYFRGMLVTGAIAMAIMPLAIPVWSKLLSHWHVVRFRVIHSWFFVVSSGLFLAASLLNIQWLLYVAAGVQGLAFGGGALAWTLGHLDFAPPHRASQYMGVHVSLTGVRGLFSPFLGVMLYEALEAHRPGFGGWVFAVSMGLSAMGGIGFLILSLRMKLTRRDRNAPIETAPPSKVV